MVIGDPHGVEETAGPAPYRANNPRTGTSVTVAVTVTDSAAVIRLTGEVDLSTVEDTALRLTQAATAFPPPWLLVLDLTAVSYLSVAGLRAVHSFIAAAGARGVRTRIAVPRDGAVRRLFDMDPLGQRLSTYDTAEHALYDDLGDTGHASDAESTTGGEH